jgi:hypothetical protein
LTGIEFADPDRGLAAALRSGAAVLFDHEEVLAAEPHGPPQLDGDPDGTQRTRVELGAGELELEIAPVGHSIRLQGEAIETEELIACRVLGTLRREGDALEIGCLGVRSQASEPDWSRIERRRSLAVAFSDGGLLGVSAAQPAGADGHDSEEVVAAMYSPEGEPTPISETLLSTQYDSDGRHRRATIELWPEGEAVPPIRAGGSIISGTSLAVGDLRLDTALFRWSMNGRPGLGRYEVLRRP